jgi:hypothetical protein
MVVALQRLEAWGDRSSSPRGGPNALSWGSAALQGLASRRFRADIGSARPVRRFHALRVITGLDVRTAEAARGPSCAFAPLQRSIAAGPHRTAGPCGSADDASSPELPCPATHSRAGGPVRAARPRAAPCHVRGLATPFAASTADPTDARGVGAPLGFALQGFARVGRAPLGALAVLTFLRDTPPLREARRRPPSRRCSRREPWTRALAGSSPRPSWACPLRSLHPLRPGRRL